MKESYIKQLIRILEESNVNTLEITSFWGMTNIKLSKGAKNSLEVKKNIQEDTPKIIPVESKFNSQDISSDTVDSKIIKDEIKVEEEPTIEEKKEFHYITAPLVGTFYSSPKPEDPPFIKKGDRIEISQTICIIEAMKIFNEIESEISGVVEEILVSDGSPVEYGQKIISIRLDD